MASPKDVVVQQLIFGQTLFEMFTSDLSDAEYFIPAAEGTNHVAWVLGHVAQTEDWMVGLLTGVERTVSEDLQELFGGSSECSPDADKYPPRKALDEMFRSNRARAIQAAQTVDDNRWDDAAPDGGLSQDSFPTVGSIWGMMGMHQ
ncbi:MAG: DinB family protein, partial [Planctomycetes bacterium]|nr:DinB family protein [Planctomycetota bacterium]